MTVWTPSRMIVGSACEHTSAFYGNPVYPQGAGLLFNAAGHGIDLRPLDLHAAGGMPVLLFKTPPTSALLAPVITRVEQLGIHVMTGYAQEVNANHLDPPATYQQRVKLLMKILAGHELFTVIEKYAGWADQHQPNHAGDWHRFYAGAPVMLWDTYQQGAYLPAADMLGYAKAAADEAKCAWGVGECSTAWQRKTDPTGQGQADAMASYIGWSDAHDAIIFNGWDGLSPQTGADFSFAPPTHTMFRGMSIAYAAR